WILAALIVLSGAAGVYFTRKTASADEGENEPALQTSVARQGDLEVYASGSGSLIAEGSVSLGFPTSGKVAELYVKPGDRVEEGEILAIQADIDALEMDVYTAQINLMEAEDNLDSLVANADTVTAQAQLSLAEAKDTLNDAEYTWYVNQEGNRAGDATMLAAEANLILTEINLDNAKDDYDKASSSSARSRANAQSRYASALSAYESALRAWNWYNGHPSEIEQETMDAEVALAEANLAEAERTYTGVADGPEEAALEMAQLQVAEAKSELASAMADLDGATIVAPFSGLILEVSAGIGDTVNGDFITIDDLTIPYLDIYIDEADLFLIDIDYPVEVTFDALPDDIFAGTVIQVDPVLYSDMGGTMVHAVVQMDENGQISELPIGVSAGVNVIAGQAVNAVLVPVEALRDLGDGEYAVFVVDESGELSLRTVEVGLIDITYAEIKSGLNQGEIVSTGIMETQ
ncbi:MAG: efflux RND transporter periplasmic adaptor subunit, partial [Anaerolineales bacterium]|nr:efflux RND transporter periplasmic adaptor subunit [Anaerolineales bacterium]